MLRRTSIAISTISSQRQVGSSILSRLIEPNKIAKKQVHQQIRYNKISIAVVQKTNEFSRTFFSCIPTNQNHQQPQKQTFSSTKQQQQQQQQQDEAFNFDNVIDKINISSYNKKIKKYIWLKSKHGADQALEVLRSLDNDKDGIQPDVTTYNSVIDAISKSGDVNAGEKANELKEEMEHLYNTGKNLKVKPNLTTYNNVILSHAKSGNGQKAEEVLREVIHKYKSSNEDDDNDGISLQPNTINYTSVIDAYAKSGNKDAGEKAEALLHEMYDLHKTGEYKYIKPDVITYNAVINAIANSGDVNAGEKAEEHLRAMFKIYKDTQNENIKPNNRTYNAVIKAIAKSGTDDAGSKAEEILRVVYNQENNDNPNKLKPSVTVYNSVIEAYIQSGCDGSKAQELLNEMSELYIKGDNKFIRPNIITYSVVMEAFSKCNTTPDKMEKIQEILQQAENDYTKYRNRRAKPNLRSFIILFDTLLSCETQSSSGIDMAEHVLKYLDWMKRMDVVPDGIVSDQVNKLIDYEHMDTISKIQNVLQSMMVSQNTN